jgi:hypothetical protein
VTEPEPDGVLGAVETDEEPVAAVDSVMTGEDGARGGTKDEASGGALPPDEVTTGGGGL